MAWTEQCKIAFRSNALGKLAKYKNKSRKVNGVLRDLSKESGIPFKTLKRWYYDRSDSISPKNGTDETPITNTEFELPLCFRCNNYPVRVEKSGKPYTPMSKYYGLCNTCRRNQQYMEKLDRYATQNKEGPMTVCPHCEKVHHVNMEENKYRKG